MMARTLSALRWCGLVLALLWGTISPASLVFDEVKLKVTPGPLEKTAATHFTFRNTGTTPVKITSVDADCTCATTKLARDSYAPGEKGELAVNFDVSSRQGPQKRTIIVSTDDPAQGLVVLSLTADLPQVMTLSDTTLIWKEGEPATAKTLVVKTSDQPAVREVRARLQSPNFEVKVQQANATEFHVQVIPLTQRRDLYGTLEVQAVVAEGIVKTGGVFVRVR